MIHCGYVYTSIKNNLYYSNGSFYWKNNYNRKLYQINIDEKYINEYRKKFNKQIHITLKPYKIEIKQI